MHESPTPLPNFVSIFDINGNSLWEGTVASPVLGLQGGETFWFGTPENRNWARVVSICYGLTTNNGGFLVEIVVELSDKKATRVYRNKIEQVSQEKHNVKGPGGGGFSIENRGIHVVVGKPENGSVKRLTLQLETPGGLVEKSAQNLEAGCSVEIEHEARIITATLLSATFREGNFMEMSRGSSEIRVIECERREA